MWRVVAIIKEVATGNEMLRFPSRTFSSRSDAEGYIFSVFSALEGSSQYATGIIQHADFGIILSDPSRWDYIRMYEKQSSSV